MGNPDPTSPLADIGRLALIIGAMKAGTTSAFEYLSGHPQICATTAKEVSFFSDDERWERGPGWYREQFAWDPARHRAALDASPRYSKLHTHPHTVERIASTGLDVRIIYLVRDPVKRVESHYAHARSARWSVADRPLNETIHPELVETTRYARQVRPYRDAFGAERVRVYRFEDLAADAPGTIADMVAFIGVDTTVPLAGLDQRHNDGSARVLPNDQANRLRRLPGASAVARLVPGSVKTGIKRRMAVDPTEARLDERSRRALLDELGPDIQALHDEFGVDLDGWSR